MAVSLEEMQSQIAAQPSQADQPAKTGVTLEEMAAEAPKPKPGIIKQAIGLGEKLFEPTPPSVKRAFSSAGEYINAHHLMPMWTDYLQTYKQKAGEYESALKQDVKAYPEGTVNQVIQSGKTVLDLIGGIWSPIEAAVDVSFVKPLQTAVTRLGELAQKHVDSDMQLRREAWAGAKPKGIDWSIHREDVKNAVADVNKAVDFALQTTAGFAGGEAGEASRFKEAARDIHLTPAERERAVEASPEIIGGKPARSYQEAFPQAVEKPRLKQVGVDSLTGKPRVRLSPQQAQAVVSDKMAEMHSETSRTVVGEPYRIHGTTFGLVFEWETISQKLAPKIAVAKESGRPVGSHVVLDEMIRHAPFGYSKGFLQKLRDHVDDVPVFFGDTVYGAGMKPTSNLGSFSHINNKPTVQVRAQSGDAAQVSRYLAHELTHAATSRFLWSNPEHALTKELEGLLEETRRRTEEASRRTGFGFQFYGLKNVHEFVAETMTNPKFQQFLAESDAYSKGPLKSLWDRFAAVVQRMLGITDPREASLLHHAMKVSQDVMAAEAKGKASGVVYLEGEGMVPMKDFRERIKIVKKVPGVTRAEKELAETVDELIRNFNPEALGPEAKRAAAVIASRIAEQVHKTASWITGSEPRIKYWQTHPKDGLDFITKYERQYPFSDPVLQDMKNAYKIWSRDIFEHDTATLGIKYDPEDSYITHAFEPKDQPGVTALLSAKYGKKWGDPTFMKDRVFEFYDDAIKAGYVPIFKNPEEIMLARQHASDVAGMRVGVLNDLEAAGLAVRKEKGVKPPPGFSASYRSPNGKSYFVHNDAFQVLHNAFETKSLWTMPGIVGKGFRGAMTLKNLVVPIRLAISGFHPIHVIHIDNAAMTGLAWKSMLAGTISPVKALSEMGKSALLYRSFYENPKIGSRLLKVWKGQIPKNALTEEDAFALQSMIEGGFTPEMHSVYKTNAVESFRKAIRGRSAMAAWHLPFALLETLSFRKQLFEQWIPNLKAASYLREVKAAYAADPSLLNNAGKRQLAFRKIAKSVDNRYGEMSYDTLFWNRWVKDLAVANTLSLGWQLGFIREYGGGVLDVGQFVKATGKTQRIKEGLLDRPLFVAAYTTTALGYAGLMTWAMTGEAPKDLYDYVFPRTGETNPDGTPQRVNTMFYTREFASLYKHIENEGVVPGLGKLASSKASGVLGLLAEWGTNVNSFGKEISDPDAPAFKRLEQKIAYTMSDLEPISTRSLREQVGEGDLKGPALAIAGFTAAPKYLTDTKTEAHIKHAFDLYVVPKQTPFERAQFSEDFNRLRGLYSKDDPKFGDALDEMSERFGLQPSDRHRLMRSLKSTVPSSVRMFQSIGKSPEGWMEQKKLLDAMTPEEREQYLPYSDRRHLRHHYEEPEE